MICLMYFINFGYFSHQYFVHTGTDYARYWQYGYREAVLRTTNETNKPVIYLPDLEQPYIFYLFYQQIDPVAYQNTGGSARITKQCFRINNAYFGKCEGKIIRGSIVITGKDPDFRSKFNTDKQVIKYPDGENALNVYKIL